MQAVSNFEAVLVKFDEPYTSKLALDNEFKQLAQDLRFTPDLLVAELKVPYRSSFSKAELVSEERSLAEKLNAANTDDFPLVFLFRKDQFESPVLFEPKSKETFDVNALRQFVRREAPNVRLLLESCIAPLDELATKFAESEKDRKSILKQAQDVAAKLNQDKKQSAKVYLKLMERVIERGDIFLQSERERVNNLLSGQMSEQKKKQLMITLNILESFQLEDNKGKDEL